MSTNVNIHEPHLNEILEGTNENKSIYIELVSNVTLFFDDEEKALTFFERGRDMVLEGDNDVQKST